MHRSEATWFSREQEGQERRANPGDLNAQAELAASTQAKKKWSKYSLSDDQIQELRRSGGSLGTAT